MNDADSRRLALHLEQLGYAPVAAPDDAGVAILNTCVVRQSAENRVYGRLGSLKTQKERHPELVVALMGCLVGVKEDPDLRRRFPYVDVFLPPSDPKPLLAFLKEHRSADAPVEAWDTALLDAELPPPSARPEREVTAFVPVVLGCSHACTFCVIPYRRGRERSRPQAEVLDEIRSLARQGVRQVTLLGQIVDRYGLDLPEPTNLAALLRQANQIEGLRRIRFLTSHPSWMSAELLEAMAELEKVCPHLELPVQAGDDEVLAGMRRGYTVGEYRQLIERIRRHLPEAAIHTDVIVGFPGENVEQFESTRQLLEDLSFDKVHVAKYSARPGTFAARRLADDVPEEEKERRRRLIDEQQASILGVKNSALHGRVVEVLVEGLDKGRWRGRTPQNKLAFFADDRDLSGQLVELKIDWTGPYSLVGRAADSPAEIINSGAAVPLQA